MMFSDFRLEREFSEERSEAQEALLNLTSAASNKSSTSLMWLTSFEKRLWGWRQAGEGKRGQSDVNKQT